MKKVPNVKPCTQNSVQNSLYDIAWEIKRIWTEIEFINSRLQNLEQSDG